MKKYLIKIAMLSGATVEFDTMNTPANLFKLIFEKDKLDVTAADGAWTMIRTRDISLMTAKLIGEV